ncbi:type II toxin-antitoxin system HicA family toxin [Chelatococcus asaccharovorans]|uniref:type II toxin-antitoxin system HicA family toxin n=1 Tax=Chelatococcus asaccharovorans TaxID=28210 RepID=UPI00224C678E|nr:type II toxin-antitoxin system HicA family toxin [Chelatococcus asaccharovorans]CAH1671966.1 Predicted RNA binding protein YcfA, dsRBD-like fold, HicA-like mRNA interferase family [Chelatococcus asaccharovorans]CAH1676628.1 Predicted RNA binding protein YcfA, dsRBD-like fold, HicA-like mRNA interferase family [Chelatococcus asaccharovorans]
MSPKRRTETPEEVRKRLLADGWTERKGKGDHRNFNKTGIRAVITVDMGARAVPTGTLRNIYRNAGWQW